MIVRESTRGGGQNNLSADEYRRAATELLKQGADGVYLFNFFTSREGGANAYEPPFEVLRELGTTLKSMPQPKTPAARAKSNEARVNEIRLPICHQVAEYPG